MKTKVINYKIYIFPVKKLAKVKVYLLNIIWSPNEESY